MCVMWLKLEGALIIFDRRSVFLKHSSSATSKYATGKKHKVFDKTFKTVLVCVFTQGYDVLVLMLV